MIEKELNFSKHLYCYLWRHSILTRMIKELSPKVYEMYSGHNLETGMKIYAHLDNDDLRQELNDKIYHIEAITKEDNEKIKKLEKALASSQVYNLLFKDFFTGKLSKKDLIKELEVHSEATNIIKNKTSS